MGVAFTESTDRVAEDSSREEGGILEEVDLMNKKKKRIKLLERMKKIKEYCDKNGYDPYSLKDLGGGYYSAKPFRPYPKTNDGFIVGIMFRWRRT